MTYCCGLTSGMDVDNGDGVIKDLPCTMRLNQLVCTGAGTSYPDTRISTFITDNKALLRRMFGEQQEQVQPLVTTPKPKVTLVRTFAHTRYNKLITQHFTF